MPIPVPEYSIASYTNHPRLVAGLALSNCDSATLETRLTNLIEVFARACSHESLSIVDTFTKMGVLKADPIYGRITVDGGESSTLGATAWTDQNGTNIRLFHKDMPGGKIVEHLDILVKRICVCPTTP